MMNWQAFRKAITPDIGWRSFIAGTLVSAAAFIIILVLFLGLAYLIDWLLLILMSPEVATIVIVGGLALTVIYTVIIDPIIDRYKRFRRLDERREGR